ncbi:MAG TPA: peptidase E [Verrucomicrobiae bacterium]|nr:peptidase E [Verrucomicrobiae bacterium]
MHSRHILAASGGYIVGYKRASLGPIIKYGLQLTGKKKPRLCYIGTATGDAVSEITTFYNACIDQEVTPSHLQLFTEPNVKDVREHILRQDMIWVDGGSVANLLAVWRVHELDSILRTAWEKGIVLAGCSAGSICWHTGGTTDSFGEDLHPVINALGFLPYSNGVHYDVHKQRRPLFQNLVQENILDEGYATDDGAAIHYVDDQFHKAIADRPGKFAYHITRVGDGIKETRLKTELLS